MSRFSGVFNTFLPAGVGEKTAFAASTWNARSLFCNDFQKLKRKVKLLCKYVRSSNIFCVQETRGSWALIDKHLRLIRRDFWIVASFCESNAGGVITFIRKTTCPAESQLSNQVLVDGRAICTVLQGPTGKQTIYNIHNYGLSTVEMNQLSKAIIKSNEDAAADPLHNNILILGDMNISANPAELFNYKNTATSLDMRLPDGHAHRQGGALGDALARYIEIESRTPTRYNVQADCGVIIDRIFCNLPNYIFPLCKWEHSVEKDPKELYISGLSDHAPTTVSISFIKPGPKESPIPPAIFKEPIFQYFHDHLVVDCDLKSFDGFERLRRHKELLLAAAQFTREMLQDYQEETLHIKAQDFTTVARVVWTQNRILAEKLRVKSKVAKTHLAIEGGRISIKDPQLFSMEIDEVKLRMLQEQIDKVPTTSSNQSRNHRMKTLSNLSKLWIPMNKQMIVASVFIGNTIVRNEPAKTLALGEAWQPTFSEKAFNEDEANRFLTNLGDIGCYEHVQPPDYWTYCRVLANPRNARPGNDTLPDQAWSAAGCSGIKTLMAVDSQLRQVTLPDSEDCKYFNDSGIAFLPKGEKEHDLVEICREPAETRPISLKNTDNKVVMAANILMLTPTYQSVTHPSQNGFVKDRNFLNNIIDLDSAARLYCMRFQDRLLSKRIDYIQILGAFDFLLHFHLLFTDGFGLS